MTLLATDREPVLSIAGVVSTLTLSRPGHANRLQTTDLQRLKLHIEEASNSRSRVLVIRALGKYFCSGADVSEVGANKHGTGFDECVNLLEDSHLLTVAVIQGGVYGGGTDLALACDFRIGTHAANMLMPATRLGLHFYARGIERYVARLGLNQAKRLFLLPGKVNAHEMHEIGFLTHLVTEDALEPELETMSETLAGLAPIASQGMKKHLNQAARGQLDLASVASAQAVSRASADLQEGVRAWKEKRAPVFKGV